MLKAKVTLLAAAGFIVALAASDLLAAKYTISVQASDLSTFTSEDTTLGKFYLLNFLAPGHIGERDVESAVLELVVDVRAKTRDGYLNGTPMIEVYALKSEFAGVVDLTTFERPSPAIRALPIGDNKRVILDITPIVQAYLKDPSSNHGLVIGSLSGMREGDFTLRTTRGGNVARIHVVLRQPGRRAGR